MIKRQQFENFSNLLYDQLKDSVHPQVSESVLNNDMYFALRYKIYEEHYSTIFMQVYFHIRNSKINKATN